MFLRATWQGSSATATISFLRRPPSTHGATAEYLPYRKLRKRLGSLGLLPSGPSAEPVTGIGIDIGIIGLSLAWAPQARSCPASVGRATQGRFPAGKSRQAKFSHRKNNPKARSCCGEYPQARPCDRNKKQRQVVPPEQLPEARFCQPETHPKPDLAA